LTRLTIPYCSPWFVMDDELTALRSIYSPDELQITSDLGPPNVVLQVTTRKGTGARLLILDAGKYPSVPPTLELEGLRRVESLEIGGKIRALAEELAGEPSLFQLITLIRDLLVEDTTTAQGGQQGEAGGDDSSAAAAPEEVAVTTTVKVIHGPCEVERKSVFQAHVAHVSSVEEVREVLAYVLALPRVRKATHSMWAYRIVAPSTGAVQADNEDDGEGGAGTKLAELCANMEVTNGLCIVSRWYGGIPLGPSRFGIIANCARKMLAAEGLEGRRR
jgi:hypothetical protein